MVVNKMRVVNETKWLRAKIICAVVSTLFLFWCSRGVNNDLQSVRLGMAWLVLPFWTVLIINLYKTTRDKQ
jgi:hypothetical protein